MFVTCLVTQKVGNNYTTICGIGVCDYNGHLTKFAPFKV
jgi:hypothetical protein